jgi:hypothetical protein
VPDSSQPPRLHARERGRARRELRYLRQVRELQLRDAGGFIFDLYRFGEQRDGLVRAKLDALIATDKEIRSLEALLGVAGRVQEMRRPGVGGTCANCGAFHSSEASFCTNCGAELKAAAEDAAPAEEALPQEDAVPAAEPAPPEPDGEVTVARSAGDAPSAAEAPASNGAVPAAGEVAGWPDSAPVASANGEPPAPSDVDPDTDEVAAVGRDRPRARRSLARSRRGTER